MGTVVMVVAAILLGVAVVYTGKIYNELVQMGVNVTKSWANIELLEKQRYDELPKLVQICNTYMKYEKETLESVIGARTRYMDAKTPSQFAKADSELSATLGKLFAVAENYPDLKAEENFSKLQTRITGLECEIADRREFYNNSVGLYNARIKQLPYVFVAGFMGCAEKDMYEVPPEQTKPPELNFAVPK